MEDVYKNNTLEKTNDLFNAYFKDMNLDSDIKKIYDLFADEKAQQEFKEKANLNEIRNDNHKRYHDIDIKKFRCLPDELKDVVNDIIELYNFIDYKRLLTDDFESAVNNQILLNNIYRKINRLDKMVKTCLKEFNLKNDKKQKMFSIPYFKNLDLDENVKKHILEKYSELVLYNSVMVKDNYEDLKRQMNREKYISEILKLINIEEDKKINLSKKDKLYMLNKKVNKEIDIYQQKLQYLQDLMSNESKYKEEFENFKNFFNKLIAYDDANYDNTRQIYEILIYDERIKNSINSFEKMFIEERDCINIEETFVFEKFGIKNIKNSLNYILANYIEKLDQETKDEIRKIYDAAFSKYYDLKDLKNRLEKIVSNIWIKTITDVYAFNPDEDYYFICSNNQFIDERYETILITKKELERIDMYHDYQIGFICEYNDNIMYITENEDIMSVNFDDMSSLKTPIQLEQEFINFEVCSKIALNGFKTKISGVYYIDDGDLSKYFKALELANQYKLPLIKLKKDN